MTQPAQPARQPLARHPDIARLLLFLGGVCFALAAIAAAGTSFPPGPWTSWALGGVALWFFALVV